MKFTSVKKLWRDGALRSLCLWPSPHLFSSGFALMAIKLTEVKEHPSLLTSSGLTIHFPAATSLMGVATGAPEHLSVHTQSPCVFEHCPLCVCVVCRLPTSPRWDKVMFSQIHIFHICIQSMILLSWLSIHCVRLLLCSASWGFLHFLFSKVFLGGISLLFWIKGLWIDAPVCCTSCKAPSISDLWCYITVLDNNNNN